MSDAIWLDVLPSLAGFASELTRGTAPAAAAAGRTAGQQWSDAMQGTGTGGAASLVAELEQASKASAATVGKLANTVGTARAAERAAAANLILAEQKLIDVREKYGEESAQAQAAEIRLESAREKAAASAVRYTAAEDQLKAAQRERREITSQLETATTDLANETSDLGDEVGNTSIWDKFRGALSGSEEDADGLSGSLVELAAKTTAVVGAAAIFADAWATNVELDTGIAKLTASMALTEGQSARAGEAAGGLYASAYGESMEEVTSAVSTVMSSIDGMKDASTSNLQEVTGKAMTLASVFDLDVSEAAGAAGQAIKYGLAPDATSAFDLIATSLQRVPEALRGDVLDAANEYGGVMAELGISGEQAFAMLVSASAGGTIAIDKVGDALKEFTINVGTDLEGKAPIFEQLGLDAGQMSRDVLAGGDAAETALSKIVAALQGVKDPSAQATAAIGLFGTPLEDLGVTEIPAFLDSLGAMDSGLGDVTGTTAEMADQLNDNVSSSLESLKRGFMGAVSEGIEPMIEPAQKVLEWIGAIPGGFEAAAIAVAALGVGVAAYTVVQWAMNTAIFASPIFWIIAAVGLLVAAVILAVENWDTITAWIGETWDSFTAWLSESFDGVGEWFSNLWEGILDFIVEWGPRFLIAIGGPFVWLAAFLITNWDEIYQGAKNGLTAVLDWVKQIPGWLADAFLNFTLPGLLLKHWDSMYTGAKDKLGELVDWVEGIPKKILDKFSRSDNLLVNAGKTIIKGFLSGLTKGFDDVKDFVGGIGSWIKDHKGPEAYDRALLVPAGGWIMGGLRGSIEDEIPDLGRTLAKVSDTIRKGVSGELAVAVGVGAIPTQALGNTAGQSASAGGGRDLGKVEVNINGVSDPRSTGIAVVRQLSMMGM